MGGCVFFNNHLACLPQLEEQAILDQDQMDHRQWTQQHLDAADLRISSMAPTPPQGEVDNDCMDVNVRGPGGQPLRPTPPSPQVSGHMTLAGTERVQ